MFAIPSVSKLLIDQNESNLLKFDYVYFSFEKLMSEMIKIFDNRLVLRNGH